VITAKCALDGLQLAAEKAFDAVIVDYELPDITGAQLAQEIRALEPAARIILLSGRSHLPAGELVYVDIHLVKGSLADKLIQIIYSLIHPQEPSRAASQASFYA
jgi:DNA-binding NarL/FixJ family response regulator